MDDLLAFLLGFGALAILLTALVSMGYYIGKLPFGWVAAPTVVLVCAAFAIKNISSFLFVAPLAASALAPAIIGFAIGVTKRHRNGLSTHRRRPQQSAQLCIPPSTTNSCPVQ